MREGNVKGEYRNGGGRDRQGVYKVSTKHLLDFGGGTRMVTDTHYNFCTPDEKGGDNCQDGERTCEQKDEQPELEQEGITSAMRSLKKHTRLRTTVGVKYQDS